MLKNLKENSDAVLYILVAHFPNLILYYVERIFFPLSNVCYYYYVKIFVFDMILCFVVQLIYIKYITIRFLYIYPHNSHQKTIKP